jgi:glutamine synthetase
MKSVIEYVWIGGEMELRSKAKVMELETTMTTEQVLEKLSDWNYDGSSTKQAKGNDSEVIIKPRKVIKCPFRRGNNYMVMCDTYKPDGTPLKNNHRVEANNIFADKLEEEPWFGIEQEFFMIDSKTGLPLGFNNETYQKAIEQGQYYCSVGSLNVFGRHIIDEVLDNLIYAELNVSGINAEVAPGQWEYQIGPATGIDAGDQLWLSRYILERTCEKYHVNIDYEPKPVKGDWNGSGLHTNYSTKNMRTGTKEKTGLEIIDDAIYKLSLKHSEHMEVYGKNNNERMTGEHETASWDKFSFGRANRGASVRIGNETIDNKKGYFEDRRPASNGDPYQITSIIFQTTTE